MPLPKTEQEILSFLGLAAYFRLWIPSFGLITNPLYEVAKGSLNEPIDPTHSIKTSFNNLKQALISVPALSLPNLSKPFILFTDERKGIALGLLRQKSEPVLRLVIYFYRQLGPMVQG